jgi:hypothetical protein
MPQLGQTTRQPTVEIVAAFEGSSIRLTPNGAPHLGHEKPTHQPVCLSVGIPCFYAAIVAHLAVRARIYSMNQTAAFTEPSWDRAMTRQRWLQCK